MKNRKEVLYKQVQDKTLKLIRLQKVIQEDKTKYLYCKKQHKYLEDRLKKGKVDENETEKIKQRISDLEEEISLYEKRLKKFTGLKTDVLNTVKAFNRNEGSFRLFGAKACKAAIILLLWDEVDFKVNKEELVKIYDYNHRYSLKVARAIDRGKKYPLTKLTELLANML